MNLSPQIRRLFHDIRFWIIFFMIIRLYGITNPPLEISHNWRQSLTSMISRNFCEDGLDLFHPKIDMAGNDSGIIGSEFPFFNFGIYLIAKLFGYAHWYGRLINLLVSSLGIWYFYKLIRKLFNERVAFNSSILLLVSIWFAFSRKTMPDTFSVSLSIIGLYFLVEYFENGIPAKLLLYGLFCLMGFLCKLPAIYLLGLLIVPFVIQGISRNRFIYASVVTIAIVFITYLWYFYHVPEIIANNGFRLFSPRSFSEGANEIAGLLPELSEKFYFSALCSYVAFGCVLWGIAILFKSRNVPVITGIISISLIFLLFIIKTGSVFPLHNYYIIPFVPVMAFIAGYGISSMPGNWRIILLVLIAVEGIANQQHDFFIKDSEKYKLNLESIMNNHVGKNDLIVINGDLSPQQMYLSHRKGWIIFSDQLSTNAFVDSLSREGAKYLVVDKHKFTGSYKGMIIFSDADYDVFSLQ